MAGRCFQMGWYEDYKIVISWNYYYEHALFKKNTSSEQQFWGWRQIKDKRMRNLVERC